MSIETKDESRTNRLAKAPDDMALTVRIRVTVQGLFGRCCQAVSRRVSQILSVWVAMLVSHARSRTLGADSVARRYASVMEQAEATALGTEA